MDEGVKTAELMFRASLALKEMALKTAIAFLKAYIRHLEWMKQNNIKPAWKQRIDKWEVKATGKLTGMIEQIKDTSKEKLKLKEREIDKFKLDKQYELESYKTKIDKAQRSLDLARQGQDDIQIAERQKALDTALENKKNFEYKTNKELMTKNHELDKHKKELNEIEYDLKVCNAKLNALQSNRNIETGRLKNEYQSTKNKYVFMDVQEERLEHESVPIEQNVIQNSKAIDKDIDFVEYMLERDSKYNEMKCNTKNTDEKVKAPEEKVDIVEQMLSKDKAALKIYKENKAKGNFNINIPNKDVEMSR